MSAPIKQYSFLIPLKFKSQYVERFNIHDNEWLLSPRKLGYRHFGKPTLKYNKNVGLTVELFVQATHHKDTYPISRVIVL